MTRIKLRAMIAPLGAWLLRRTRFRLRTLQAAVTLCAIVAWWCGVQLRVQREERSAIARLDEFDCDFMWSAPSRDSPWSGDFWSAPSSDSSPARAWLAERCPLLARVTGVSIGGGPPWDFDDADVALLDAFGDLEVLELYTPELTDAGLERACRGRHDCLISLVLDITDVTDVGIEKVGVLPCVRSLSIRSWDITDRSVRIFALYPCLEKLSLNCPITDRSLPAFAAMPNLRELELFDTEITEAAMERFRSQHPQIMVEYQEPRHGDRSGMSIKRVGMRTVVDAVDRGSPAAAAGLQPGDIILRIDSLDAVSGHLIDSLDAASMHPPILRRALCAERRVIVAFEHAGKEISATLNLGAASEKRVGNH